MGLNELLVGGIGHVELMLPLGEFVLSSTVVPEKIGVPHYGGAVRKGL